MEHFSSNFVVSRLTHPFSVALLKASEQWRSLLQGSKSTEVTNPRPQASSFSLHPPLSIPVSRTEHCFDVMPLVCL